MRIKTELLDYHIHYYHKMPEKQRKFYTEPERVTYEDGKTYITFRPKQRYTFINIGFDREGNLFIKPEIGLKSGKVSMTEEEIQELFELFIDWLSSAARNGFLEIDEGCSDG